MTTTQKQSLADILNEIQSCADAATPVPWEAARWEGNETIIQPDLVATSKGGHWRIADLAQKNNANDATFIASARTNLPKLVKAQREARTLYYDSVGGQPDMMAVYDAALAAILTSPENGEQQRKSLGEPGATNTFSTR